MRLNAAVDRVAEPRAAKLVAAWPVVAASAGEVVHPDAVPPPVVAHESVERAAGEVLRPDLAAASLGTARADPCQLRQTTLLRRLQDGHPQAKPVEHLASPRAQEPCLAARSSGFPADRLWVPVAERHEVRVT
jgi:hypothetical protein